MPTRPTPFQPHHLPAGEAALRGVRNVTLVGLLVNVALAALKFTLGVVGSSRALIADAVHSLSDLTTDLAILIGVRYWTAPADARHPYGHGRIETVITALIGITLGAVAVALAYNALVTLRHEDISHPGWIAFAGAVASIAVKEALYRWTVSRGRRLRSSAVIANAWHHRSDAFSSVPVAIAVAAAALNPAWSFLDHIAAVVVSVLILRAAWRISRPAFDELVDRAAAQAARQDIRRIAAATPGVREAHQVRARQVGPSLQVDLHVLVDPAISVREGHDIAEAVKRNIIRDGPDVLDAVVHVEPYLPPEPPGPATPT